MANLNPCIMIISVKMYDNKIKQALTKIYKNSRNTNISKVFFSSLNTSYEHIKAHKISPSIPFIHNGLIILKYD